MNNFSYLTYKKIIDSLSLHNKIYDFSKINKKTKKFLVLRHDVEFSPYRALQLAEYENKMIGVKSSYFFQFRNSTYNIFSYENLKIIEKILFLGHKVGLHLHKNGNIFNNKKKLVNYIKTEIEIFNKLLKIKTDRFSFHRPNKKELKYNIKIKNLINVYSDLYFQFFENEVDKNPEIKYFSDSLHKWNHGNPFNDKKKYDKIQLLTHPYSWSQYGENNKQNLIDIINENKNHFKNYLSNELKFFPKIK